jgi:hypothetical protein
MTQTSQFQLIARGLAERVLASTDLRRTDRLWPVDPMAFQTNPLNVAHGACGVALFLNEVLGELPHEVRDWLTAQPVTAETYPPGLYSGIAGIAWTFAELGLVEQGARLLDLVPTSRLAFESADVYSGCAGWGLASLAYWQRTGSARFLELACRAGETLLLGAERNDKGLFWFNRQEGVVPLGFALGGSGIGLFLLYLWQATNDARYLDAARAAIDFEVAHAQPRGDALHWGTTTESQGYRPYWLRGGAGVAAALIRFAWILREPAYEALARRAATPCGYFFSAAPHLFEGLASMGETLLDMFLLTGEEEYLAAARLKAEQTLLYRVKRSEGVAFPGRYLLRISHDYGIGGAGIGLFLHRVSTLGPRPLHDFMPGALGSATLPGAELASHGLHTAGSLAS